ncbi:MAG: NUDIX domain-containing protein [Acidimicrobiales bacterium]
MPQAGPVARTIVISPADELVEVVDAVGNVERVVTRAQMRAEVLRHRSTYIVVRRRNGDLVVHRRADWKDVNPGLWDIAFGGVVGVGEDWTFAAQRELAEEAGLTDVELLPLGSGTYDEADGRIVARVFEVKSDAELNCPDGEVAETTEIPPHAVQDWLQTHAVCPDTVQIVLPLLMSS